MSTTHPCPNCGWTLRWVPEHSSWACDRCSTVIQAQPQQTSGLAPNNQRPVATSGGAFGGSAASSSPARGASPSQPPGDVFGRSPSQPPGDVFGRSPSQPPGVYQAPTGGQFGGSAGASQFGVPTASPSLFGPGAYAPPQAGGFGGSAGAAQPRAQSQSGAPPMQQPMPQQPVQQPPPQAPQPGYGPGGYPSYTPAPASAVPEAAPAPKKSKGLLIGVVAAVAIIAGVVIAIAVGKGGGSKPGLASADEVIDETIAALGAGDTDRLVALVSPDTMKSLLSCDDPKQQDSMTSLSALVERFGKFASKAKGLSIERVKLSPARTTKFEKGKALPGMKGCTVASDWAIHDHDLEVKVKLGDKPAKERSYKISLAEVEGRWFLGSPPAVVQPGDCATAMKAMIAANKADLDTKKIGDTARLRLEKAAVGHCTEDGWPDEAITCFEAATTASKTCAKQLTATQAEKLDKKLSTIIAEDIKSREVPGVSETPTVPTVDPTVDPTKPVVDPTKDPTKPVAAGSGSGSATEEPLQLPPICDDYKVEIDKLAACRRIKASIRTGQVKIYNDMLDGWNRVVKKTPEMVTSMEGLCKRAVEMLVDLRKTSCR